MSSFFQLRSVRADDKAFEGGFELLSRFKPTDDKPWLLIVGQRGK